ncbi:hypothetical protein F5148DRAFT_1155355 [Russula earlei]|uniref:Uncharacterized protein n=1 Tax=Russula earlei TaxID=71964 RepID=A0ACC0UNY6_9AGAM|nr:hypothetical protein F5148DRAFT_1155355 [Russula earlei]
MAFRASGVLFYMFSLHLVGIYLFTRGFLLRRLSLSVVASCSGTLCTLPPTHQRAVLLIIDSLRFDFLSPHPPEPHSPYHHNILTLPRELTAKQPRHSFLFNAHADPPTATLQRIKGLVTGSLPTFIDIGYNFGGASIAEDSIIQQLRQANRTIAFMGDDTWLSVFPSAFHPEMTHDFDSFNVEDLDTVDNGHQMNDVLKRVVDALDKDTLLVVLGDHGMDRKGDHGGDGDLEVSSGLWIYSKGPALSSKNPPTSHLPHKTFPGEPSPHRSVQQIDLVPTLSLLLGLPIPLTTSEQLFPSCFGGTALAVDYAKALDINARQVHTYLDTYRDSASGGELDGVWSTLENSWARFQSSKTRDRPEAAVLFTRLALETCRSLWARFNRVLMVEGLTVIALSLVVGWGMYERSRSLDEWEVWMASFGGIIVSSAGVGAALSAVGNMLFRRIQLLDGVTLYQSILFGASVGSSVRVIISAPPKLRISWTTPILLLHSTAFLSNSYAFWEDRAVPFFILFTLVPQLLTALSAPTARLRYRIFAFAAVFAACVRLMAISTVCREEQHPWCSVTFFSGSGAAEPPALVRVLIIPTAVLVPYGIRRVLAISKSDNGIASLLLPYVLPPTLIAGSTCWLLEWLETSGRYEYPAYLDLRLARTILGWTSVLAALGGAVLWLLVPVALHVSSERINTNARQKTEVRVLGFANAYGAPFVVLWALALAIVWLAAQPSAQISLALATAALLAHLELIDAARDARALTSSFATDPAGALARLQQGLPTTEFAQEQGTGAVTLDEVVPLALLAQLAFFATGHQATLVSLQWKAAFVLTPTVSYTLALLFVGLNTLGPTALLAFAAPLVGIWNVAPLAMAPDASSSSSSSSSSHGHGRQGGGRRSARAPGALDPAQAPVAVLAAVRAAIGTSLALGAAWLRRHLMVWKVFAPRYMLGALELLLVDAAVLVGVGLGVGRSVSRISRIASGGKADAAIE